MYRYDGETFTQFHRQEGLASDAVQCAFMDKEGRMWFGGVFGLFRYDGKTIVPVGKDGPWE